MSTYKTKAIILKECDCLEADRLFYIYTPNRGKEQLKVKGAKKIQSKLSSHVMPMAELDLFIAKGRNYERLASAQIARNFANLKNDLEKIAVTSSCLELVEQLTKLKYPDREVYNLILAVFEILDSQALTKIKLKNLLSFFTLKFLHLLGYTPELYFCLYCHEKIIPNGNFFDGHKGGLVCGSCRPRVEKAIPVTTNAIKMLRLMISEPMDKLLKVKVENNLSQELGLLIGQYLGYHLDKPLKSQDFVDLFLA